MSTLKLSICILTYNRAGTLREALESILPQITGNPEVEVVISDNASTDDTPALCREFQSRYPAVRYCPNPANLEVDGNIVSCVEKARGEYLSFFSDDDLSPAGSFQAILDHIHRSAPAIIYINHTPFLHDDPTRPLAPMTPAVERLFSDGKEFFKSTGLGFLSSLIVRTDMARRFSGKVQRGRFTAHLDMAARIALSESGPFMYAGNITALARCSYESGYDILVRGQMAITLLYRELEREGLLLPRDVKLLNRAFICTTLPRAVAGNRRRKDGIVPASRLIELYGDDWLFYLLVYPLLILPRPVLRGALSILRPVYHFIQDRFRVRLLP